MSPRVIAIATLLISAASLAACGQEPTTEPAGELLRQVEQAAADCNTWTDTGYQQGNAFQITLIRIDGKPIEIDTGNAFWVMQQAALADGVNIQIVSGFRTMQEQQYLYGCYVNCNCNNCNLAARPGYSNHQSGHALDLNTSSSGVYNWLAANGAYYGFSRTVPSEAWHWEWWGGGPGGGVCGASADPECETNPNFESCNGSIIERCENGQYETGDCGFFGASCSTAGGRAHCVDFRCSASENATFCTSDTEIGTCESGQYSEGDCGVFGATCSEDGGSAHCLDWRCGGQDNDAWCVDGTQIAGCEDGQFSEGDCAAFGATCSEEGGAAHCVDFRCANDENDVFCINDNIIATCEVGQYSEGDCAFFGASCSDTGPETHCIDARCQADENGAYCLDGRRIGQCEWGAYTEGDCGVFGATCSELGGQGHCVDFRCSSGENTSYCIDSDSLASCNTGVFLEYDCAADGATCVDDAAGARCSDPDCVGGDRVWCDAQGMLATCSQGTFSEEDCAAQGQVCDEQSGQCVGAGCSGGDGEWCEGDQHHRCEAGVLNTVLCSEQGQICTPGGCVQPPNPELCDDAVDNDGDGAVDCEDPSCAMDPACSSVADPPEGDMTSGDASSSGDVGSSSGGDVSSSSGADASSTDAGDSGPTDARSAAEGCGCRVAAGAPRSSDPSPWWLASLLVFGARRRRR